MDLSTPSRCWAIEISSGQELKAGWTFPLTNDQPSSGTAAQARRSVQICRRAVPLPFPFSVKDRQALEVLLHDPVERRNEGYPSRRRSCHQCVPHRSPSHRILAGCQLLLSRSSSAASLPKECIFDLM